MSANGESGVRGSKHATPITRQKLLRKLGARSSLRNRLRPASDSSNVCRVRESDIAFCQVSSI
jgi:hypothetical protein